MVNDNLIKFETIECYQSPRIFYIPYLCYHEIVKTYGTVNEFPRKPKISKIVVSRILTVGVSLKLQKQWKKDLITISEW